MATQERLEKPDIVMVDDREDAASVTEKARNVYTIDNMRVLGLSEEDAAFYNSVTPEQRKRITHKVSSP